MAQDNFQFSDFPLFFFVLSKCLSRRPRLFSSGIFKMNLIWLKVARMMHSNDNSSAVIVFRFNLVFNSQSYGYNLYSSVYCWCNCRYQKLLIAWKIWLTTAERQGQGLWVSSAFLPFNLFLLAVASLKVFYIHQVITKIKSEVAGANLSLWFDGLEIRVQLLFITMHECYHLKLNFTRKTNCFLRSKQATT